MSDNILFTGARSWAVLCAIPVSLCLSIALAGASEEGDHANAGTSDDSRERKMAISDATSAWGYYGAVPESPDGRRLCYAVFPHPIDLSSTERYPVYPAELWVCQTDGTGHRRLHEGRDAVHNGLQQSWVDNERIVFSEPGSTSVINASTGEIEFGPFEGFAPAHFGLGGKVLMYAREKTSSHGPGIYELEAGTGKMRTVLDYDKGIWHLQSSPDGRKALFTTAGNTHLALVNLDGTGFKQFPGKKPMHFQWFDNESFFGYAHAGVVGCDFDEHRKHDLYRWNLEGRIVEHLAGHGCHGAARRDGKYFAGESWYGSNPIVFRVYSRGQREPAIEVFSHSFVHVTWRDGGRHHVNPSFSRDGRYLYYNKAVADNVTQAFRYDLAGLVEPMK